MGRELGKIAVFKIGGKIINTPSLLDIFLDKVAKIEGPKIIIHGGGKKASEVLSQMGIKPKMVEGRRITDAKTLEIVTMVYGGLINKNLVAKLQAKNVNAIGISGADCNIIQARKRPVKDIDYGYAGDIETVNEEALIKLCNSKFVPVICSLTHDKKGHILNTNADTIASEISSALARKIEVKLKYCFELKGVLRDINDDSSLITELNQSEAIKLHSSGVINDGMIPKLKNGFNALENGVYHVSICHIGEMDLYSAGTKLTI
jgi:acetylglutamate kinase